MTPTEFVSVVEAKEDIRHDGMLWRAAWSWNIANSVQGSGFSPSHRKDSPLDWYPPGDPTQS